MKTIIFHPAVEEDVEAAAAWYDGQKPGLGREFRFELQLALTRIAQNPQLYGVELGKYRACPLRPFSYTVYYIDREEDIWLAAVAHQKRRAGYWKHRRPE